MKHLKVMKTWSSHHQDGFMVSLPPLDLLRGLVSKQEESRVQFHLVVQDQIPVGHSGSFQLLLHSLGLP